MKLGTLKDRPEIATSKGARKAHQQLQALIEALREKEEGLPHDLLKDINGALRRVNELPHEPKTLQKELKALHQTMLQQLSRQLSWVPQGYYRNLWMSVGMAALGIPLGVVMGLLLNNLAFIGIGLPIGLAIGIAYGSQLDQKAAREGRQLSVSAG